MCFDQQSMFAVLYVQNASDDVFDLGELLSTLSRHQLDAFWCSLNRKCTSALLHLDEVEDDVTFSVIYLCMVFW